jgi:hypothetical protein
MVMMMQMLGDRSGAVVAMARTSVEAPPCPRTREQARGLTPANVPTVRDVVLTRVAFYDEVYEIGSFTTPPIRSRTVHLDAETLQGHGVFSLPRSALLQPLPARLVVGTVLPITMTLLSIRSRATEAR